MASNTTLELLKSEGTLDMTAGVRNEGNPPSKERKQLSVMPSEAREKFNTRQSALTRYAGSFKLRFLGDGSTCKFNVRKGAKGASSNTTAEDIVNHQKQTEYSPLKLPELGPPTEGATFAETESSAAVPPAEKTTDEANVVIPVTLKPDITANNSTEANNVVQDPEDRAVVIDIALRAGKDGREEDNTIVSMGAGGDGEERGGGGCGNDCGDSDSEGRPLTPSELPEEKEEEFRFFLPEEEPVLHRDFQQRAKRAVQAAVLGAVDEQKQSVTGQCFQCCNACCECDLFKSPKPSKFTPQLKVASTQGLKMMKKLFSPALPRVLRDLWVYAEIAVTLYQFILGLISLSLENNQAFNINFSLFIVGGFFLLVSVYFMRIFMVIGSIVNLVRIPLNASKSRKSYLRLIIWFSVHVIAQVLVSAVIIVTVAVKINDENSVEHCPSINSTSSICASPFLIYSAVVGGIIPLFGVASFFVVNFYQMRQLSAGLWIDMISLLQSESFADLVFQGGGVKVAKTKAKDFVQQIELNDVKKQYKAWRNSPVWASIVYPFKIPLVAALGILYELLLASFLITIFFGPDFDDLDTAVLVWYSVVVAVLVIANLSVILFTTLWLLMALAMLLLAILLPVYVLLQALLLYIPIGAFFGCLVYCSSSSSELGVFQKPAKRLTHLRKTISGHGRKPKQEEKNTDNEGTPEHHNAVVASESVPMPINLEPVNSSQMQQVPTGDLITIEFVDTQNA